MLNIYLHITGSNRLVVRAKLSQLYHHGDLSPTTECTYDSVERFPLRPIFLYFLILMWNVDFLFVSCFAIQVSSILLIYHKCLGNSPFEKECQWEGGGGIDDFTIYMQFLYRLGH